MKGIPKAYVKVADSGNRRAQALCPGCVTQLYATEAATPLHSKGMASPVMPASH